MQIFLGNLAFAAKEKNVYELFIPFGSVSFVKIVMEKKGDKSRGFGFLEMPDESEAQAAIAALNGKELLGRPIKVEAARPMKPKAAREFRPKKEKKRLLSPPPVAVERRDFHRDFQQEDTAASSRPDRNKRPGFRKGRRTRSFMERRLKAGITEPLPERKNQVNPMRWRKKKPWQKKREAPESGHTVEGGSKPWMKKEGSVKPGWKSGGKPKKHGYPPVFRAERDSAVGKRPHRRDKKA